MNLTHPRCIIVDKRRDARGDKGRFIQIGIENTDNDVQGAQNEHFVNDRIIQALQIEIQAIPSCQNLLWM